MARGRLADRHADIQDQDRRPQADEGRPCPSDVLSAEVLDVTEASAGDVQLSQLHKADAIGRAARSRGPLVMRTRCGALRCID
jgi:hypothetical protein